MSIYIVSVKVINIFGYSVFQISKSEVKNTTKLSHSFNIRSACLPECTCRHSLRSLWPPGAHGQPSGPCPRLKHGENQGRIHLQRSVLVIICKLYQTSFRNVETSAGTPSNKSHNPSLQYGQPLKRLSRFALNLKKVIPGRLL